jgi:hypothetical protein
MNVGVETLNNVASQRRVRLAVQLLFLVFMGALIATSRRYFDLHMAIPGHTGILWMFLLVTGRAVVKRDGAGVMMGASAALWGEGLGLGHSLHYNLALYSATGLALDILVRTSHVDLAHPLAGLIGGITAHGAKFLFMLIYALGLELPKHFLVVGALTSFGSHLLFGALGGLLAGLALWLASRGGSPRHRRRNERIDDVTKEVSPAKGGPHG